MENDDNCSGHISVLLERESSPSPTRHVRQMDAERHLNRTRGKGTLFAPTFVYATGENMTLGEEALTVKSAEKAIRQLTGAYNLYLLDSSGARLVDGDSAQGQITVVFSAEVEVAPLPL